MKRVLVTGASGFIGRHALPELLTRGYEVHAVARRPLDTPKVHWHSADLLDASALAPLLAAVKPSHLLHFAWYAEPGKFWTAQENFAWLQASMRLLDSFAATGGRRVVAAGSCAEYDWGGGHCEETATALRPATTYGICKDLLRRYLDEYARVAGLSAGWGRIFHLYGPYEDESRLVASVIRALGRGGTADCTAGTQVRDFLHAADAAAAFVALLDGPVVGAVNIASGKPVSIAQLVTRIGELMGARERVRLGALPMRAGDPPVLTAAVGRLADEVGWQPGLELSAGLSQTIQWWRQQE